MNIDTNTRNVIINKLLKFVNNNDAIIIEKSINDFTIDYVEDNQIPMLIHSIYESKSEELINLFINKDLKSLIEINKLNINNLAFLKITEILPELYNNYIQKKLNEEKKSLDAKGTSLYTCKKCKKSNCNVTQRQTRSADEPPTIFASCLECGFNFRLN